MGGLGPPSSALPGVTFMDITNKIYSVFEFKNLLVKINSEEFICAKILFPNTYQILICMYAMMTVPKSHPSENMT